MKFQIVKLNQSTIYEFAFEQAMTLRTKRIEMASNYLRTHREREREKESCKWMHVSTFQYIVSMCLDIDYES